MGVRAWMHLRCVCGASVLVALYPAMRPRRGLAESNKMQDAGERDSDRGTAGQTTVMGYGPWPKAHGALTSARVGSLRFPARPPLSPVSTTHSLHHGSTGRRIMRRTSVSRAPKAGTSTLDIMICESSCPYVVCAPLSLAVLAVLALLGLGSLVRRCRRVCVICHH